MTLGDPGCLAPLLLNVYTLQPGQAIFVPAGEIHAYIQGDCIEVGIFMVNGISDQVSPHQVLSCGDNVLFCGLVHDEDVAHFPPELTDPHILSQIVNFQPVERNG